MSDVLDEFIERARAISFADAVDRLAIPVPARGRPEYEGPCPRCGGRDRFAVNRKKAVWVCRGCGAGGKDGIGLAAHVLHYEVRSRTGFLGACSAVLKEPVPQEGEHESDEQRAERQRRIAEAQAQAERNRQAQDAQGNIHREREINKARGMWLKASTERGRDMVTAYLQARTGFVVPPDIFDNIRFIADCGYYEGEDEGGRPLAIYSGPVMIAPIVDPSDTVIGCHQTWIDLSNARGKSRPVLWGVTKKGREARRSFLSDAGRRRPPTPLDVEAGLYTLLPTKKMRGSKKGGLIPILGDPDANRWLGGEGIENVMAVAGAEGFRKDTFYFSAGDIGNLAGPADPDSAFPHPTLKKQIANGQWRRVSVPGPKPKEGQNPAEALQVRAHVRQLLLVADGDSEPLWTASAMARAQARLARADLDIQILWPPEGTDFSGAISAAIAVQGR
ncbi:P4 alpha zinc-binding domain-containing protein [Rhizobium sp. CFBP 8762]|uniref:DUF7146 domain-containing protein n=1 Tax=Rhizobium sp. CFBP 8762 TaxID=2775279 RepID=UPI00177DF4C1|nr:primase-helicase zinc-binding domain-containing protein [Rhizobium sp. CFBP 8762]MBD8556891.1 P4 alpha zinc-binding domain-containing protein [Rhizobium sp. CFBP 8762]